jgi:hypothetical protein
MSRGWIRILVAIAVGVFVTAIMAAAASVLKSDSAREVLFWSNTLLQSLLPAPNIGTVDHSIDEGTPLNLLASMHCSEPRTVLMPRAESVCECRFSLAVADLFSR